MSSGVIVGVLAVGLAGVSGVFWTGSAGDAAGVVDGVGEVGASDVLCVFDASVVFCALGAFGVGFSSGIIPFLRVFIFE